MVNQPVIFSGLPPRWQWLIRRMQEVDNGELRNLVADFGERESDARLVTVYERRYDNQCSLCPEAELEDFVISPEMNKFIEDFESLDGLPVKRVVIRNGRPLTMEVECYGL